MNESRLWQLGVHENSKPFRKPYLALKIGLEWRYSQLRVAWTKFTIPTNILHEVEWIPLILLLNIKSRPIKNALGLNAPTDLSAKMMTMRPNTSVFQNDGLLIVSTSVLEC